MSDGRGSSLSCCLLFLCSPTFRLERRSASTPCGCCSPQNPTTNTKLWWKRGQQRSLNRDVPSVTPKLTSLQWTPRGHRRGVFTLLNVVKYRWLEVVLGVLGCSGAPSEAAV